MIVGAMKTFPLSTKSTEEIGVFKIAVDPVEPGFVGGQRPGDVESCPGRAERSCLFLERIIGRIERAFEQEIDETTGLDAAVKRLPTGLSGRRSIEGSGSQFRRGCSSAADR